MYRIKMVEGRCPFLNDESLCDVHINFGAEHMCTTCKVYLRKNWAYGDIRL
jgi:lysine-N-methylase